MSKKVSGVGKQVFNPPNRMDLIKQPQEKISQGKKSQVEAKVKQILAGAQITVKHIYVPPSSHSPIYVGLEKGQSSKISQIVDLLIVNGAEKTDNRKEVILDGVVVNVTLVKYYKPAKKP